MVGTYRSGTSAIVEAVGSHPRILCGDQVHHRDCPHGARSRSPKISLNGDFAGLLQKHRTQVQNGITDLTSVIGFKRLSRSSKKRLVHPRFAPAIIVDRLEGHLKWLARNPQVRVVHVVRTDNLAWLESKALAHASGRYSGGQYPDSLRLELSPTQALRRVATKTWIDGRLASLSVTNPYLRVNHGSVRCRQPGSLRKDRNISRLRSRRVAAVRGCITKSRSRSSLAGISNMDAIRDALAPTGHAYLRVAQRQVFWPTTDTRSGATALLSSAPTPPSDSHSSHARMRVCAMNPFESAPTASRTDEATISIRETQL